MKRSPRAVFRSTTTPSPTRKTSTPARASKRRYVHAPLAPRRSPPPRFSALSKVCQLQESFVRQDRHHHCGWAGVCDGDWPGVVPRTGKGLPGGVVDEAGEGDAAGFPARGEAAGVADAPGWVLGSTAGGFTAAAG